LVEAFDEVEDSDARLLVVGKPTDEREAERIERLASGRSRVQTEFRFVPENEVQTYLNAADALVLPYQSILTSGTAVLGMSFGTPVVGPATGCIPEYLDEQLELLYDPERETVADAMGRATTADLADIGERNRAKAMTFRWDDIAQTTSAVYEQCLDGVEPTQNGLRRERVTQMRDNK
jgi:glycosyltransferase involved in cell wall biosynthesis